MTNPKTLARTNDPQTSKDAAKRMVDSRELNKQENMVYDEINAYIRQRALNNLPLDFTTKDIARFVGPYEKINDICRRRFSGLESKGKIEPIELIAIEMATLSRKLVYKRRDGCRVWRLL